MVLHSEKIGGPGKVVEIDESKFGRRKYHRGHRVEGQWVFGGIERNSGRMFLTPVEKRSGFLAFCSILLSFRDAETLIPMIEKYVEDGATIISDFWKAYDLIDQERFEHLKVNHSLHFVDPEDSSIHTNTIESSWRHVKASMPQYHRKKAFFAGRLAKYLFLKQCRARKLDPTLEFFRLTGSMYDPTNKDIIEDYEVLEEIEEEDEEDDFIDV